MAPLLFPLMAHDKYRTFFLAVHPLPTLMTVLYWASATAIAYIIGPLTDTRLNISLAILL